MEMNIPWGIHSHLWTDASSTTASATLMDHGNVQQIQPNTNAEMRPRETLLE